MAVRDSLFENPLFGTQTKTNMQKRLAELSGVVIAALGVALFVILFSYSAVDPNLFNETTGPVDNRFGRTGATIATALFLVIGWAAWVLPTLCVAWGVRFFRAEHRPRRWHALVWPFFTLILCVHLATYPVPGFWQESWPMGGLLGDALLTYILNFYPLPSMAWVGLYFALLGALVWSGMLAFGLRWTEGKTIAGYGMAAVFALYAMVRWLVGFGWRMLTMIIGGICRGAWNAIKARFSRDTEEIPYDEAAYDAAAAEWQTDNMRQELGDRPVSDFTDPPQSEADLIRPRIAQRIKELIQQKKNPQEDEYDRILDGALGGRQEPSFLTQEPVPNIAPDANMDAPHVIPQKPVVQHAPIRPTRQSRQAKAETQPDLLPAATTGETFVFPPLGLLSSAPPVQRAQQSDSALQENARMLENILETYGVRGDITSVHPGPVVTLYELEPVPGLKASRVIGLADDIARSMSALAARVSTVPGRTVIGIELPNENRETVYLREILSSQSYGDGTAKLPLALGKDISGKTEAADLSKMPHLLIAGTTGSGKSVAINTMILSLLYKLSPEECRIIMIDPKMLELSVYDGIPHLLSPVVTDPKKAVAALKWVVGEMEDRYRKMSKMGVRNIIGYNDKVKDALSKNENFERTVQTGFCQDSGEPIFETEVITPQKLPYIVVVVDEMADLMMVAGKEIEACIQRLAQMARASGIHLIMATQRPSVDVITGTIKANFPTRVSFQVTSKVDSRTILGEMGAEQLLGMGDMLYMAGGGRITRIHSPFVSDEEVEEIVKHLKAQGAPDYVDNVVKGPPDESGSIDAVLGLGSDGDENALYDRAVWIVAQDRKCSTSYIQRKLSIGYNKAAKLVEEMEQNGVVSTANHVGKREVLVPEPHNPDKNG